MPPDLIAAMRKATRLTRAQDLMDATRLIQRALNASGKAPESRESPPAAPDGSTGNLLRLPAAHRDAPSSPADSDGALHDARPATGPKSRTRRPLGEVIRILRELRQGQIGSPPREPAPVRRSPPVPEGARFETRAFSSSAGSRSYKLYVPSLSHGGWKGVIVMLHGCSQDADDFALGTQMNALAEAHGLLVAYPEQARTANPSGCWNWFDGRHQRAGIGEPAIIAGITQEVVTEFALPRAFVAGLSAGGAMAALLAATHPEIYGAVGIHSGLPAGAASDVASAFAAMRGDNGSGDPAIGARSGANVLPVRTIVFHGDCDQTVNPVNGARIVAAAAGAWGPGRREDVSGRAAGGRAYSRRIVREGDVPVVEYWRIHGAGHAWSGGEAAGSFTDPSGPDASSEMVRFFLAGERTQSSKG